MDPYLDENADNPTPMPLISKLLLVMIAGFISMVFSSIIVFTPLLLIYGLHGVQNMEMGAIPFVLLVIIIWFISHVFLVKRWLEGK